MKALRRFLAVTLVATAIFVCTGCDEDDDPTFGAAPFLGRAWSPVGSLFFTNGVAGGVSTGL